MLKRLVSLTLVLVLALSVCGALAENGNLRHKVTGDISEFTASEELSRIEDTGKEAGALEMGTDVYLFVDPDSASFVTFVVVDEYGEPIPGAAIYLSYGKYTDFFGTTDSSGRFSTYVFRDTRYGYTVKKSGYIPESGHFTATGETKTVRVVLRKLNNVDIFILDNDVPVKDIQISIGGYDVVTDADGHVRVQLPNGVYPMDVTLPDGTIKSVNVRVQGDTVYVLDIGKDDAGTGLGDLFIVFNKYYDPEDYDLTEMIFSDAEIIALLGLEDEADMELVQAQIAAWREENHNFLRIVAEPDKIQHDDRKDEIVYEDGEPLYTQRSLMLSGWQLLAVEEKKMQAVVFENEDMGLVFDIADLYTPEMAKLFHLVYAKHADVRNYPEFDLDDLDVSELDFNLLPDVWRWIDAVELREAMIKQLQADAGEEEVNLPELTRKMFGNSRLEVRITPLLEEELLRACEAIEPYLVNQKLDEVLLISPELKAEWLKDYLADGNLTRTEYEELEKIAAEGKAYRVQVFVRIDGCEVNVTDLLHTLEARLNISEVLLYEAEVYTAEQLVLENNEKTAEELKDEYIQELYPQNHILRKIRNGGDQHSEAEYEAGEAVFDFTAQPVNGWPADEALRKAAEEMLSGHIVDIYDVDVRFKPYEYKDLVGRQYYTDTEILKDRHLMLNEAWYVRLEDVQSGSYLIYEPLPPETEDAE